MPKVASPEEPKSSNDFNWMTQLRIAIAIGVLIVLFIAFRPTWSTR